MGFDPRIVKSEAGQQLLTWRERTNRDNHILSFEAELESTVSSGVWNRRDLYQDSMR